MHPFEAGTFRHVAKGTYTEGERAGEACVCKWFKTGTTLEAEFYADDIKAVDRALKLVQQFNLCGIVDKSIILNIPEVWTFMSGSAYTLPDGTKVLQEPFIDNYQKFNSNSGWADDDTPWPRVMQALSHFSYHSSGGQYVLCDLQGGVYRDGIVLTDPAVLSVQKEYGVTDLGPTGISTFFAQHTCNEFCKGHWKKPADMRMYHEVKKGTSMVASAGNGGGGGGHFPTRASRPFMSAFQEESSDDDY
jgi:hypothetical protein